NEHESAAASGVPPPTLNLSSTRRARTILREGGNNNSACVPRKPMIETLSRFTYDSFNRFRAAPFALLIRARAILPEVSMAKIKSVPRLRAKCLKRRASAVGGVLRTPKPAASSARSVASIAILAPVLRRALAEMYLPLRELSVRPAALERRDCDLRIERTFELRPADNEGNSTSTATDEGMSFSELAALRPFRSNLCPRVPFPPP